MATSALYRHLARIGIISVVAIGLIGFWLLHLTPREKLLPPITVPNGPRPKVMLRQGTIVGIEVQKPFSTIVETFLGIPYGLSTEGKRRFRPPLPINASTGEIDASKYGSRCPAGPPNSTPQHEDCLNLNIYRPKVQNRGKKLPVLIHIYGGSFNFGFGHTMDISSLVASSAEAFIGITFNYRVGALGFLSSKLTADEGLLNVGLKDQVLLFHWVQENIAEFDGDPDNVTLMGSSAGAHSIGHHLMRNTANSLLFHKAIIESGAATARAVYTPDNPLHENQFRQFVTELGCGDVPENQIMDRLRALPVLLIKEASESVFETYDPSVRWPFQPVIDGDGGMIPVRPVDALRAGNWHKVPILTGFNTNEGAKFVPYKLQTSEQFTSFFRTLLPGLSEDDLKKLNQVYPDPVTNHSSKHFETRKGVGAQYKRTEQAYGHFAYTAPVRQTVQFAATHDVPVYLYHFALNSSIKGGADHGTHIPFVTYSKDIMGKSDTIDEVAGLMNAYWTSFITTGDPNMAKGRFSNRALWPPYVPGKGKLVIFGDGNDEIAGGGNVGTAVKVADDIWAAEECDYWWARTELFET